jgi:hypothetical protein
MKVSYNPSFEHFVDNYLATYYAGGVSILKRTVGGPLIILAGALLIVFVNDRIASGWLRVPLVTVGLLVAFYGVTFTLGPLFNIFLVWLRREELYGRNNLTTLELKGNSLEVTQGADHFKVPLKQIQSVQQRRTSTWIITHSDNLVYFPRELASGNYDKFVQLLEEKLAPEEEAEK